MDRKRDLTFWQMWNLSFGFFGVQTAYALQNNSNSRIFATLGADPHSLSYFWILPPLMGLIVQPIIGSMSDRTWNRFGRRIPYLLFGAIIAVIVMCFFPNAGSLGLKTVAASLALGAVCLMLLDTSLNIGMQPFKMMVGDLVNERQKAKAYSIQSFLCNAGSLVGYVFPFALAAFTGFGVWGIWLSAGLTWFISGLFAVIRYYAKLRHNVPAVSVTAASKSQPATKAKIDHSLKKTA